MNLNSQIDWSDTDRIVSNDTRYVSLNGEWWRESSSWQTRQNGSPALTRVGLTRTRLTGHDGRARPPASPQGFLLSETHSYAPLNAVVRQSFVWDPTEPVATRPLAWFGSNAPPRLYTHDGNKNVSEVVAAASGTNAAVEVVAHYDYSAFGAVIAQKGDCAETNPWRFSSEYEDTELGLYYYNYRHYEPVMGRWLSRDPMPNNSGILYAYVDNDAIGYFDKLGLLEACPKGAKVKKEGSSCKYRTNRDKGGDKKTNGCGADGGFKVPDSFFGVVSFEGCCNAHDKCYGTCGQTKYKCDLGLGACMASRCMAKLWWSPSLLGLCVKQAEIYTAAVLGFGGDPFDAAQDENCEWEGCCCDK